MNAMKLGWVFVPFVFCMYLLPLLLCYFDNSYIKTFISFRTCWPWPLIFTQFIDFGKFCLLLFSFLFTLKMELSSKSYKSFKTVKPFLHYSPFVSVLLFNFFVLVLASLIFVFCSFQHPFYSFQLFYQFNLFSASISFFRQIKLFMLLLTVFCHLS